MNEGRLDREIDGCTAIVGAGLAGLAAARTLAEHGQAAVVFDKGRGPGGRSSSRRAAPFAFDQGAQYFTARAPDFRRELRTWLDGGVAARWDGRIVSLSASEAPPARGEPAREETERFVGTPGMNALGKHLARGLDVRCATRVAAIERGPGGWRLLGEDGAELGEFARLLVTAPPAQAAELIGDRSPLGRRAAELRLRPCYAVLLGLAEPYGVPFDGAFCEGGALSWVARDNSKPGRPASEAWVLHASPEWTEAHWDGARERVMGALAAELERLTGVPLPAVLHRDAHRWRYAQPDTRCDEGCLADLERGLVLAGDAYNGGRVEGAYLSGVAAARALAGR